MIWTSKTPTRPGWYWWRGRISYGHTRMAPLLVQQRAHGLSVAKASRWQRAEWQPIEFIPGEWAGPIEIPKEEP